MNISHFLFPFLCSFLVGCSATNTPDVNIPHSQDTEYISENIPPPENIPHLPPVETQSPNSQYEIAFENQTRVPGTKSSFSPKLTLVTDTLESPWWIAPLPDGRMLITEKKGNIRIVATDGQISNPLKNMPPVNVTRQWWLLGITPDPKFAENRIIYFVFSKKMQSGDTTSVAKARLSPDETTLENVQTIYEASPSYAGQLHYWGRIIFDTAGYLVISIGERSDLTTRPLAQDLASTLGKIIRIDTDGNPAPDNPKWNTKDARKEIFTFWHRNPQGLALHPETGKIWSSEMWPHGGDEINHIVPWENYGWPTVTYGIEYSGKKVWLGLQHADNMQEPIYFWDPSVSPSGITFYAGEKYPEWNNNLFVGMLSWQHISRLVIENEKVIAEERLFTEKNERFRDITQGNDGFMYTITDNWKLYRIEK